ncbi:hypothetical protein NFI96_001471 [Prochilodus magdalenae]|nr:hypothetical protein NFI96_001471 [Prochilodus magdalenae]
MTITWLGQTLIGEEKGATTESSFGYRRSTWANSTDANTDKALIGQYRSGCEPVVSDGAQLMTHDHINMMLIGSSSSRVAVPMVTPPPQPHTLTVLTLITKAPGTPCGCFRKRKRDKLASAVYCEQLLYMRMLYANANAIAHSYTTPHANVEAIVEFDYQAQHDDELTIAVGEIISNIRKDEGGWWEGEVDGRRGLFPDNFVRRMSLLEGANISKHQESTGSSLDQDAPSTSCACSAGQYHLIDRETIRMVQLCTLPQTVYSGCDARDPGAAKQRLAQ